MTDLSSEEREIVAESLGLLADFYRANPKLGYVSPTVYNQLRKYGSDHFGSSEGAADGFAQLAEKVRASQAPRPVTRASTEATVINQPKPLGHISRRCATHQPKPFSDASPELSQKGVPAQGFEPWTLGLRVPCSTN